MLCTYLCAATFSSWITLSHCGFKYADDDGGYKYCWTRKFVRRYEPHQVREQAISALKEKFNSSFCDISYILTIDPWLKHNQTRYKVFIIAEHFVNQSINQVRYMAVRIPILRVMSILYVTCGMLFTIWSVLMLG